MERYGLGPAHDPRLHPSACSSGDGCGATTTPAAAARARSPMASGGSSPQRLGALDAASVFGQAPWMQPVLPPSPMRGYRRPEKLSSTASPGGACGGYGSPMHGRGCGSPLEGGATWTSNLASGFGTWNELIVGGVVDRPYVEAEAERRKQDIDRAMENQIVMLENQSQEQRESIVKQAEYHLQMADRQIDNHKRQHLAHVSRQAELQAYSILQRAEMEKGRLGQEAARALQQHSEREKAVVAHDAMRQAEDVWRESQRALLEQAHRKKGEIDAVATRRAEEIDHQMKQAFSRVYISPHSPVSPAMSPAMSPGSPMASFAAASPSAG